MDFTENKICRICLENGVLTNIFNESISLTQSDKIMICASVKILKGDGLPELICSTCCYKLDVAFQFKQQCEANDYKLREYLGFSIKNEGDNETAITVKDEIYTAMHVVSNMASVDQSSDNITPSETGEINSNLASLSEIQVNNIPSNETKIKRKCKKKRPIFDGIKTKKKSKHSRYRKKDPTEKKKTGPKPKIKEVQQCFECGKVFKCAAQLEMHIRTHTGERPFICSYCPRRFAQKHNLAIHTRTHTGEKPFQCEICSKQFSALGNFQAHQKIHSGVREHICHICQRAFIASSDLNRHIGTHSGVKPHVCTMCGKAFYRNNYLNAHIRTVHIGEKRHKCLDCGKGFSNTGNLNAHVSKQHGQHVDANELKMNINRVKIDTITISNEQTLTETNSNYISDGVRLNISDVNMEHKQISKTADLNKDYSTENDISNIINKQNILSNDSISKTQNPSILGKDFLTQHTGMQHTMPIPIDYTKYHGSLGYIPPFL